MEQWFLSLDLSYQLAIAFVAGLAADSIIIIIMGIDKNKKISAYQRQLEKKSVSSEEDSARVKVLEQKIEVLEKALDNALNK